MLPVPMPSVQSVLDPRWCSAQATWRERRRFQETAHTLIRLPESGVDPWDCLLTEETWRRLAPPGEQEETVLTALSQTTGIYFFPSREWVGTFCRFVQLLRVRRVLEAGAGRGYLAAVLAPWLSRQGIDFQAIDCAQGEFESGLPRHPVVVTGDAFAEVEAFRPDLVLSAWPPPGQSIAPFCHCASVRYVVFIGEAGGGCTGDPADWHRFRHRSLPFLSRFGVGRSGRQRQDVTVFFGAASQNFWKIAEIRDRRAKRQSVSRLSDLHDKMPQTIMASER
ncbi:MAG TPA: hypothetical protein DCY27_13140 [Desulfobacterales bacterium]|nr:hypothetical protein [Desulfobacterales bacterium]